MKKRYIALMVVTAVITGLGIAANRIASVQTSNVFTTYGSWHGTGNLPLDRDELVTTQVTLFALFALPSYEAVYLFANNDDKDDALNGAEDYSIVGNTHDIKAAYWSITAYGQDLYLVPNAANRFSINNNTLITDSSGNFKITVSAQQADGNWLPSKKNNRFRLVLRVYQGDKDFIENLGKAHLPIIQKNKAK